jgi:hypothetical protein
VSKGTLRFLYTEPVPARLITAVARSKERESAERAAKKKSPKSKGPAKKQSPINTKTRTATKKKR